MHEYAAAREVERPYDAQRRTLQAVAEARAARLAGACSHPKYEFQAPPRRPGAAGIT